MLNPEICLQTGRFKKNIKCEESRWDIAGLSGCGGQCFDEYKEVGLISVDTFDIVITAYHSVSHMSCCGSLFKDGKNTLSSAELLKAKSLVSFEVYQG